MIGKIMGTREKSEELKGEKGNPEDLKRKEVSCSICLEIVAFGGDRSTARLQCGHEFHLDCIGSAFNAKGSMQCPNCRKIEKGSWLYANKPSRNPLPDLNMMDEWTTHDEDLYDLSYSEMPVGVHWCPFGRLPQFSSFFEEGESSPPLTFPEMFSQQAVFPGQVAVSTTSGHPCPYITYINPLHSSSSSSSSSLLSSPHHNRNHLHHHPMDRTVLGQVLGQPLQQIPPPHPPPSVDLYHSWNPFQYSGLRRPSGNGVSESEGQARGGRSPLFDFLGNSSRSRNPTSLVPPLIPQFVRLQQGMPDPSTTNMFQWPSNNAGPTPSSISPENTTPFCLFPQTSSNTINIPTEDGGGNRFYAWERDRFAPYPLMPVENVENGWWGQDPESEQRRGFWQQPRNRSDGSSYRGPRMQSFM